MVCQPGLDAGEPPVPRLSSPIPHHGLAVGVGSQVADDHVSQDGADPGADRALVGIPADVRPLAGGGHLDPGDLHDIFGHLATTDLPPGQLPVGLMQEADPQAADQQFQGIVVAGVKLFHQVRIFGFRVTGLEVRKHRGGSFRAGKCGDG